MMQNFCRLVPKAFEACFKTSGALGQVHDDSEDEGEEVGAPVNQTKVWRKLARLRQAKAGHFLQDAASGWATSLWVVLTAPVMHIHYSLFKHATWFSERRRDDDEGAEPGLTAFSFCRGAQSPAQKAMRLLMDLGLDENHEGWGPCVLAFGPVLSWSQARLRTTRRSLCVVIGQLWRKLLYPWTQFPWRLSALIDPEQSQASKEDFARKFFQWPDCCLDGFARKLREIAEDSGGPEGGAEFLLNSGILDFVQAAFERVVPTSTCIERQFARLSEWSGGSTGRRAGPKPQLSSIASKHCNHTFSHCVDFWRSAKLKQKSLRLNRKRPQWCRGFSAGRGQNGWHLFYKDLLEKQPDLRNLSPPETQEKVRDAWAQCSAAEKARWANLARGANLEASHSMRDEGLQPEFYGGFWDIGASEGWPLARHTLAHRCNKVKTDSKSFHATHNILQPENAESLEDSPKEPWPIFPACPVGACQHCCAEQYRPTFERLLELFWIVVLKEAPAAKAEAQSKEPLLLSLKSASTQTERILVVAFHTRRAPLQAAVLLLHKLPEPGAQDAIASFSLSSLAEPGQMEIFSESLVVANLCHDASDWVMEILQPGPVRQLGLFDIVARRSVDAEPAGRTAVLSPDVAAALQAFEIAHPASGPKKRRQKPSADVRREPGKKRPKQQAEKKGEGLKGKDPRDKTNAEAEATSAKAKAAKAMAEISLEQKMQGLMEASSESEPNLDSEVVSDPEEPAAVPPLQPLLHEASEPASSSSQPRAPRPNQASTPTANAARRLKQKRGEAWGMFRIAPIYTAGAHSGWEAQCNLHHNTGDLPGHSCKKAISRGGGLDDRECQLRLKRWLVAGLDDKSWPDKRKARTHHVSLGGLKLKHFATGLDEAALDAKCGARSA